MYRKFAKLPVMLVLMLAFLMLVIDSLMVGVRFSFANQLLVGGVIFLSGLAIIIISGIAFRMANTTVDPAYPENTTRLVTTGFYRISRNPMYIGFLLWLLACVVIIGNVVNMLLLPAFIVLVNKFFIIPEEVALEILFGDDFRRYKGDVRRWI